MDFHEFFNMVREKFIDTDVSSIDGKLAIQINLTGEAAGAFYIEVKDKSCPSNPTRTTTGTWPLPSATPISKSLWTARRIRCFCLPWGNSGWKAIRAGRWS